MSHSIPFPFQVLPGLFLGNEIHAASLQTLRVLNISCVLNVGAPQCFDHFRDHDDLTYVTLELFDNRESNFASVFLHQAFPLLSVCLSKVFCFAISRHQLFVFTFPFFFSFLFFSFLFFFF